MKDNLDVLMFARAHGVNPTNMFPRTAVQEVACARCGARPGEQCQNRRGAPRSTNHLERCFDRIRAAMREPEPKV